MVTDPKDRASHQRLQEQVAHQVPGKNPSKII
jgi:hypothetical protein